MRIRRATEADLDPLATLEPRLFREAYVDQLRAEDLDAFIAEHLTAAHVAADLRDPTTTVFVAEDGDAIMGFATIRSAPPPVALDGGRPLALSMLYVDAAWHGRGVGPALMTEALGHASRDGHDVLWLTVWEHNARAIRFYAKHGFAVVGEDSFQLGSDVNRDLVMARRLDPHGATGSIRSICVFCGASAGMDPAYAEAAEAFGRLLAERGIDLVTGGGRVGLMGAVAGGALAAGGRVTGVIPRGLVDRELAHTGLTRLDVVDSLHERKARMAELADAFVALPGGLGTLEELAEVVSWAQLGLHRKPIGLLDVGGYWTPLLGWVDAAVTAGFVPPEHRALFRVASGGPELLGALQEQRGVASRWDGRGAPRDAAASG